MNEIIYKGLKLTSDKCKYYNVVEGNVNSIQEDINSSTLTLTYSPFSSAKSISNSLGISLVGDGQLKLESLTKGPTRFKNTYVTLNGLRFKKLTAETHTISVVIVEDSESRVVQNYYSTIFVVSVNDYKNPDFIKFLFYSGNLLYLQPLTPALPVGYELRNFPKILVGDRDVDLESDNETVYTLRRRYNDYLIREIDYQDQFILELRKILDNYGIGLVRINKETTLSRTSYITYQINQTPVNSNHHKRNDYERNIMSHRQPIDFTLHTTDMVLYHDFKSKFTNLDLLTNFTEFVTLDKVGNKWLAAIRWGQITEDFNHTYQPDDNSNFAFQCQFRCELFFSEVADTRYEFLNEILTTLESQDIGAKNPVVENNKI